MIDVAANPSDAVEKALDLFGNDILRLAYSYMKSRSKEQDLITGINWITQFMTVIRIF